MPVERAAFTLAEYDRRIAKICAGMNRAGMDLLCVTDPSNQAWLTRYDGWSFYVHQGVILAQDGDAIWWGGSMILTAHGAPYGLKNTQIREYSDNYLQNPEAHPMGDLAALIAELGHETGRIGVEMENYYYSAKAHAVLSEMLPNARFCDATSLVNWQRAVKSDEEIDFIRKAARVSDAITLLAIEKAEPGMRKNDLVGEITQAA